MSSTRVRGWTRSAINSAPLAGFVCTCALLACGPDGSRFASQLQVDGGFAGDDGQDSPDARPGFAGAGGTAPVGGTTATAGTMGGVGGGGTAGAAGSAPVAGTPGTAGTTAIAGTTGTGGTGMAGATGTAGMAGTAGSAGMTGTAGSAGTTGAGGVAGSMGTAGMTGAAGTTGAGGTTQPPADTSRYNFESDLHGWRDLRGKNTAVARATGGAFAGNGSLEISLATTMPDEDVVIGVGSSAAPAIANGSTVTFRVWFPAGAPIASVQPFVLDRAMDGKITWTGAHRPAGNLQAGQWNTITLAYPANVHQLLEIGVEWKTTSSWTGKVRVDAVTW